MPTTSRIPRRRQPTPPQSKQAALLGALTSLVPSGKSAPAKSRGSKRKSAGGLAMLAGLGAAAMKAKKRRSTPASS